MSPNILKRTPMYSRVLKYTEKYTYVYFEYMMLNWHCWRRDVSTGPMGRSQLLPAKDLLGFATDHLSSLIRWWSEKSEGNNWTCQRYWCQNKIVVLMLAMLVIWVNGREESVDVGGTGNYFEGQCWEVAGEVHAAELGLGAGGLPVAATAVEANRRRWGSFSQPQYLRSSLHHFHIPSVSPVH